jgi:hypothetical protein
MPDRSRNRRRASPAVSRCFIWTSRRSPPRIASSGSRSASATSSPRFSSRNSSPSRWSWLASRSRSSVRSPSVGAALDGGCDGGSCVLRRRGAAPPGVDAERRARTRQKCGSRGRERELWRVGGVAAGVGAASRRVGRLCRGQPPGGARRPGEPSAASCRAWGAARIELSPHPPRSRDPARHADAGRKRPGPSPPAVTVLAAGRSPAVLVRDGARAAGKLGDAGAAAIG